MAFVGAMALVNKKTLAGNMEIDVELKLQIREKRACRQYIGAFQEQTKISERLGSQVDDDISPVSANPFCMNAVAGAGGSVRYLGNAHPYPY